MDKIATTARVILTEKHNLPAAVVATVQLATADGLDGNSGVLTVGYTDAAGKRKVTAQTVTPSLDDAFALLADCERVAGLIALGVRAMPATFRPVLPEWVAKCAEVRRHDEMRARAKSAARAAVVDDSALPWAA